MHGLCFCLTLWPPIPGLGPCWGWAWTQMGTPYGSVPCLRTCHTVQCYGLPGFLVGVGIHSASLQWLQTWAGQESMQPLSLLGLLGPSFVCGSLYSGVLHPDVHDRGRLGLSLVSGLAL